MAKIEAPNKGYNGNGPGGAVFVDGVAETDDEAALNYYRTAGYKVSGKVDNPIEPPTQPDPREYEDEVVGTRLRDAAVDPRPEDFLAPINAGKPGEEGNPHGPNVVSPEIHASGPAGIRPGEVFVEDIAKQEAREKAFAEARLIERKPGAEAVAEEVDLDDKGDLGMSDPGSAEAGRAAAAEVRESESAPPAKSDNKAAWVAHAVAQGADEAEANDSTKAELIERYGA
jgi:hypothetical protein